MRGACRSFVRVAIGVSLFIVAVAVLGFAPAHAEAITLSSFPTSGSVVPYGYTWADLNIKDTSYVPMPSLCWFDGVPTTGYGSYAELSGHWEPDPADNGESEIWVVDAYDYTNLTYTVCAPSSPVADGHHTAKVQVNASVAYSWGWDVAQPPAFDSTYYASPNKYATTTTPTIRIPWSDNGGSHTATITVNGTPIPASVTATEVVGTVTTPLSDLSTATVNVTIRDSGGLTGSTSWSFKVVTPGSMTVQSIAPTGTVASASPSITATILSGAPLVSGSITVDGSSTYNGTFTKGANDIWTFKAYAYGVYDGSHSVTATFKDDAGNTRTASTSFVVDAPPSVNLYEPANNSRLDTPTPVVNFYASDNGKAISSVTMRVDGGESVVPSLTAGGYYTYHVVSPLAGDATHTVSVTARDSTGNQTTATTSFWVYKYPRMATSSCDSCHLANMHEGASCDSCHQPYHSSGVTDCSGDGCHGAHVFPGNCADCHTSQANLSHENVYGVPHLTSEITGACTDCHSDSLTREHARYQLTNGQDITCTTCHKSADTRVLTAISTSNTACSACHSTSHPHRSSVMTDTLANGDRTCGSCHSMDIVAEHTKSTALGSKACTTCHSGSPSPRSLAGTWNGRCDSPGCHAAGSSGAVHERYCLACHASTQPDFAKSKVDFSVGEVDRTTVCRKCHWEAAGSHPYHNATWNCGACHSGMGVVDPNAVPKTTTASGSFATTVSAAADAATLHAIHEKSGWAATITIGGRQCASCHAAASCTSCHEGPLPSSHADHSWDASTATYVSGYGPSATRYGSGTSAGNERENTLESGLTCSNTTCHDIGKSSSSPTLTEDYDARVRYTPTGAWGSSSTSGYSANSYTRSNWTGAKAEFGFSGGRVDFISDRGLYRGRVRISIDSVETTVVDLYAATTQKQVVVYTSPTLASGAHTITVEVTGTKNTLARDTYVFVDAFRVYPTAPAARTDCTHCHADKVATHG